jgi:hypothetical protein
VIPTEPRTSTHLFAFLLGLTAACLIVPFQLWLAEPAPQLQLHMPTVFVGHDGQIRLGCGESVLCVDPDVAAFNISWTIHCLYIGRHWVGPNYDKKDCWRKVPAEDDEDRYHTVMDRGGPNWKLDDYDYIEAKAETVTP